MNIMITCLNNLFEHAMSAIVFYPRLLKAASIFLIKSVNDVTFFQYHVTLNKK